MKEGNMKPYKNPMISVIGVAVFALLVLILVLVLR